MPFGTDFTVSATLTASGGTLTRPIGGVNVHFGIDGYGTGYVASVVTSSTGVATARLVNLALVPGEYTLRVVYDGYGLMPATETTQTLTVVQNATKIVGLQLDTSRATPTPVFTATLKDAVEQPLAGQTVRFTLRQDGSTLGSVTGLLLRGRGAACGQQHHHERAHRDGNASTCRDLHVHTFLS